MASNSYRSGEAASAAADAFGALLNNGYLRFYDGSQPSGTNSLITTQNLLATARFNATAFQAATNGVASANPITSGQVVTAGTCTWFRAFAADGTTAHWDGSVGTSNADCIVPTTTFTEGVTVTVTSATITEVM